MGYGRVLGGMCCGVSAGRRGAAGGGGGGGVSRFGGGWWSCAVLWSWLLPWSRLPARSSAKSGELRVNERTPESPAAGCTLTD